MESQQSDDILGPKKMNYDFLLLVRDKKYPQALVLGKKILQLNPDNPSVQKFCSFIQKNNTQLVKMVQKQKQQQEYQSADSDQSQEQQEQEQQEQQGVQKQSQSDKQSNQDEQEEQMEEQEQQVIKQKRQKIELTTCTLNQIPHICPRHHKQMTKKKQYSTGSTQITQNSSQNGQKSQNDNINEKQNINV